MSRPRPTGRTTAPRAEATVGHELPPLRKRRPGVFWFVIIATFAMVLTTFASFFTALS